LKALSRIVESAKAFLGTALSLSGLILAASGAPDQNDFSTNCPAQGQIYPAVVELRDILGDLVGP
jgi:hypothetical protein